MFVCQHCERYLKDGSTVCPFCQKAVTAAPTRVAPHQGTRLSRAAAHAVRAAIIAAPAVVACGGAAEDESRADASGGHTSSGGTDDGEAMASSGGRTNEGSGGDGGDGIDINGDGDDSAGGEGGEAFVGIPIYGGPFPDMMRAKV